MFLLINKPKGITSHDVISRVRKIVNIKKIGHAGTLDPLAIGLLIVGIGRESTKKLGKHSKDTKKSYVAEIFLGEERDTDDAEGKVVSKSKEFSIPDETLIKETIKDFQGEQKQTPPIYSAIKIKDIAPTIIPRSSGDLAVTLGTPRPDLTLPSIQGIRLSTSDGVGAPKRIGSPFLGRTTKVISPPRVGVVT